MIGVKTATARKVPSAGFSLLELVVALGIFILMVLAMGGIFSQVIASQRAVIANKNVQESLSYALEVVAKELRSARRDNFDGSPDCFGAANDERIYASSSGELLIQNKSQQCVKYYLNNATLMRWASSTPNPVIASTTSSQVRITGFDFLISDDDVSQPRVTLKLEAEAASGPASKQKFKVQTTISSRFYEHN